MSLLGLATILTLLVGATADIFEDDEPVIDFHGIDRLYRIISTAPPPVQCEWPSFLVCPFTVTPRPSPPCQCVRTEDRPIYFYFNRWGDVVRIQEDLVCATARGDPHYVTFDNCLYDYHGICTYILTETCAPGIPQFRVLNSNHHRNGFWSIPGVSSARDVTVEVYGHVITIGQDRTVTIDGETVFGPRFIPIGGNLLVYVAVVVEAFDTLILTDFGLLVRFDGRYTIKVCLPPETFGGKICGMFGDLDGDANNDLKLPDGTPEWDPNVFGNSWVESSLSAPGCNTTTSTGNPETRTTSTPDYSCPSPAAKDAVEAKCDILSDPSGPFAPCHPRIPPNDAEFDCVSDGCVDYPTPDLICSAIDSYATECRNVLGTNIQWRSQVSGCDIVCSPNSHYEEDVRMCDINSCAVPDSSDFCDEGENLSDTSLMTTSGCVCDAGYLYESGDTCVPESQCGCTDIQGKYYRLGDSWTECGTTCTCNARDDISCDCASLVSAGCTDTTAICFCDDPLCPGKCLITPSGYLTNGGVAKQLQSDVKLQVAETIGLDIDPCKMLIQVRTDAAGNVLFAGFNFGVHPHIEEKFYVNFVFNLWGNPGVAQRGFGIVGVKDITIPAAGFFWSFATLSVSIQELTPTSWELKATCATTTKLVMQYGTAGSNSVSIDMDMPGLWQGECF